MHMAFAFPVENATTAKCDSLAEAVAVAAADFLEGIGLELGIATSTLALVTLLSRLLRRVKSARKHTPSTKLAVVTSRTCAPPRAPCDDASAIKCPRSGTLPKQVGRFVDHVILARLSNQKAIEGYAQMQSEGSHLRIIEDLASAGSPHKALDFYAAMIQCAGRAGRGRLVIKLIEDAEAAGVKPSVQLHESAMRLLAGKNFFHEALEVFDRLEKKGLGQSATTMSCAIGFASELDELDMAAAIYTRLCKQTTPSLRACMSVLRVYAKRADWKSSVQLLSDALEQGVKVDSVLVNIVLCTCISAGELDVAGALLNDDLGRAVADVVSYNTVLKGLAQSCNVDGTLKLLYAMIERHVQPNLISFNTALDATVRARRDSDTWKLYEWMVNENGMRPDKCTCSTLVKSFTINRQETVERVTIMLDLLDGVAADCPSRLVHDVLKSILSAALRLNEKSEALALAWRAFRQLLDRQMSAPVLELRKLLAAAVSAYFADSLAESERLLAEKVLRAVWSHVGECVSELEEAKCTFDKLVERGQGPAAATRSALNISSAAPAKAPIRRLAPAWAAGRSTCSTAAGHPWEGVRQQPVLA